MKQIIFTIILLFTATVAGAQQKNESDFAKRLYEARLAEVSLRLNLNDSQKEKFAPIYEQYCNEITTLVGNRSGRQHGMRGGMRGKNNSFAGKGMRKGRPGMRPQGEGQTAETKAKPQKPEKENLTDAEKVQKMKERMEKQKKVQEIRLSYADKFATVLSDKQLVEFYQVEDAIQQKMRNRATRPHGKKK